MKQTLSYLILGQRGGQNRIQIIESLRERPYNHNQLAEILDLNYRTVKYHLDVLSKYGMVSTCETGGIGGYGRIYFLSPELEENMQLFEEIKTKSIDIALSSRFFQNLIEQTNDAIIIIDNNNETLFWNDSAEKLFGYKKEEVLGYTLSIYPDKSFLRKILSKNVNGQKIASFETKGKHKSGRLIDISVTRDCIRDENDNLIGFSIVSMDITERKLAERKILELKEFSESIIRDSPAGIVTTDLNGGITSVNPAALRILGSRSEEKTKQFNVLTLETLVKQGIAPLFERCIKKGEKVVVDDLPYTSFWGKTSILCLSIAPLMSAEGARIGTIALMEDLTERKKAEEALRISEKRLNALFQAAIDGIGVEKDGTLVYANSAYVKLFGFDEEAEIVGKPIDMVIAPGDRKRMHEYSGKRLCGKYTPRRYEFTGIRRDGSTFHAEISVSTYNVHGEQYIVGFVRDITESKKVKDGAR
ncbi:MAG: PAS domain S-box protein [Euryarchaeota archaeon]|nr:PAS domain S-box protein [Euryarchaeota archaeon]